MAIGKAIGEFSVSLTNVTVTKSAEGGQIHQGDYEGRAHSDDGTVLGTMTFMESAPGSDVGKVVWNGANFMDNGDTITSEGQGIFNSIGTHKWRVRSLVTMSDGTVAIVDSEASLENRKYTGTLYEWE